MSTQSVSDPPSPPPPPPPAEISPKDQKMLALIRNSAPALLQNIQSGLSRLPVELVWAAHSQWPLQPEEGRTPQQNSSRPIRISILDSSFNPPTLAHLALANSARPNYSSEPPGSEYDAKLLLLSVKNADKTLKPGDASYPQRLEMMALLAQEVKTHQHHQGDHNLAIAIVDEPTFVGKSRVLQEYLRNRLSTLLPEPQPHSPSDIDHTSTPTPTPITRPQLTFIVGMDTLERLFSPRYYPPPPPSDPTAAPATATAEQTMITVLSRMLSPYPEGDDTLIVCAKRGNLPSDKAQKGKGESGYTTTLELGVKCGWMKDADTSDTSGTGVPLNAGHSDDIASPNQDDGGVRNIPKNERIVIINIGDRESKFSSTAVRNARARMGLVGSEAGGGPWKQWVTKSVAQYVQEEKLYVSV